MSNKIEWPSVGSGVTFKRVTPHWYNDVVKNARELLEPERQYTLAKVTPYSSWCAVELEEFPGKKFSLGFFEYPVKRHEAD